MSDDLNQEREIEKTLTLRYPFKFGTREVEKFEFEMLKAKHLRNLPPVSADGGVPLDLLLTLIQRLAHEPPKVVDELRGSDLSDALEIVGNFFGDSQETGKTASAV